MRTFPVLQCKKTTHFGSLLRVLFTIFLINTTSTTQASFDGLKEANSRRLEDLTPSKTDYDYHNGIVRQTTLKRSPNCVTVIVLCVSPLNGAGSISLERRIANQGLLIGNCTCFTGIAADRRLGTGYFAISCSMLYTCSEAPAFPRFLRTMRKDDLSI